jgi:hypothetical protein
MIDDNSHGNRAEDMGCYPNIDGFALAATISNVSIITTRSFNVVGVFNKSFYD